MTVTYTILYIRKCRVEVTSVGLAHARPINPIFIMSLIGTVLAEHSALLLLKNLRIKEQKNSVATAALAMLLFLCSAKRCC